ncbi:MAG: response regulator [Firmicutes bacterium]|nr:response regulator [Bacillota bacterium]
MCNLLIAEDEKYLREKVTQNVDWGSHGYQVFVARDGEEALEIIKNEQIHILVTDIRMPGMDGLELTERAKAINEHLKVIIISGHAEFELAQSSIRLGVEDYLLKPFRTQRLLDVVQKAREKLDAERERRELQQGQEELAKQNLEKRFRDVFGWLVNPKSFLNHAQAPTHHRLGEILKTGTHQELQEEIGFIHAAMDEIQNDPDNVFILLSDVVVSTLTTLKALGFDVEQGIALMSKHLPNDPQDEFAELKKWVESFLLDINELIESRQQGGVEKLISTMKAYVDEHYRSGVSLNMLAERLNMSSSQLSKLFYEYVGENFSDYVNKLKGQKAKELLKGTDKRIYEIADYLGFSDTHYFSAWFKRTVGVSPTDYREGLSIKK